MYITEVHFASIRFVQGLKPTGLAVYHAVCAIGISVEQFV